MIWERSGGHKNITKLAGTAYRLVESQQQVATMHYVDTLQEQALLEQLLEQSKPKADARMQEFHYLLRTPFRYPPLKWGSRFGRTHVPGIFYAAKSIDTTLAETAYYRFVFLYSMAQIPDASINTQHTLFNVDYATTCGVNLEANTFSPFRAQLRHVSQYQGTQELGSAMREAGVEAFEYASARDLQNGLCVGIFVPEVFAQKQPKQTWQWSCQLTNDEVMFKEYGHFSVKRYGMQQFLDNGKLPMPA